MQFLVPHVVQVRFTVYILLLILIKSLRDLHYVVYTCSATPGIKMGSDGQWSEVYFADNIVGMAEQYGA